MYRHTHWKYKLIRCCVIKTDRRQGSDLEGRAGQSRESSIFENLRGNTRRVFSGNLCFPQRAEIIMACQNEEERLELIYHCDDHFHIHLFTQIKPRPNFQPFMFFYSHAHTYTQINAHKTHHIKNSICQSYVD